MIVKNENETLAFAKLVGKLVSPQTVLILTGDLGAGKTTFTKGLAEGLGISQMIKSPTYTIIREYTTGRLPLYHMDIYRVENGVEDLGIEEYFENNGVCVVEWGEMLGEEMPEDYLEIILKKTPSEQQREITLKPVGQRSKILNEKIMQEKRRGAVRSLSQ
ncbi:tRNA threonylcarbamoyladenosine biosynthesis protein TsaE [Pilibacter termitis]|uniref:tRNA threonylcarbamoyladenosine biosynthesis protein TsaE n=1 Tax=Pilibacter termitis TaxID=263852 RepID=A0A1T4PBR0_9ENTE|nr:tRNA (adenosine(37)-N6)-threonylcarbamoyltransferase complex ATPase subunit type 1 TsaE [Pilibacter termitis]SJZ88954.1 tRNA threonylcarbamoyladenosine biosynthesis protein TsaE [Pilibacter termitis]